MNFFRTRSYLYLHHRSKWNCIHACIFLILQWNFQKRQKLLTVSLLVALYYGSLIWEFFRRIILSIRRTEPNFLASSPFWSCSWLSLALIFRKNIKKKKKFIWEFPNYYSEKDDKLWQEIHRRSS